MCGIVGWKKIREKVHHQEMVDIANTIAHRGPDGEGYYFNDDNSLCLAHKRLAIIDPLNGQQPMKSRDKNLVITFNGAIYNFLELRRELISLGYPIQTYSDTEVLLYSYQEWGESCLKKLNGMFAFVIYDVKNKKLFGARDRLGEKPLYYYHDNKNFIFASEIKAILESGVCRSEMNHESLHEYLTFQYYLADNTLFNYIFKLKPGHYFVYDEVLNKLSITEYWDVNFEYQNEEHTEEFYIDQLQNLINDSISLRLRADVPLGSHLSGGIDSSAVATLNALRLGENFKLETFTGKFAEGPDFDESSYAKLVSKNINSNYNEILITSDDFLNHIKDIIWFMDEPQAGPGVLSQFVVAKKAREKVKVVLGGQGGDETFIGYTRYFIAYYSKMLKRNIESKGEYYRNILNSMTPSLFQINGYQMLLQDFWADGIFDEDSRRYFRLSDRFSSNESIFSKDFLNSESDIFSKFDAIFSKYSSSIINKMSYFDLKTFLPSLLHVEDRTSMVNAIESRVPLIDHRIIEFVASIPVHIKFKNGISKYLLKKVFKNIVPDEVLNRTDKKGFPTPTNIWFKTSLSDWVKDLLSDRRTQERGLYNRKELIKLIDGSGKFNRSLWGVINLELWHRRFLG